MNENQFNQNLDELMMAIEDAIEEQGLDIDYETSGGILTLTCPNGSQIILSRQTPLLQLWLAAKSGGFHFDFDDGVWMCKGEALSAVLSRCLSEQYGNSVSIKL